MRGDAKEVDWRLEKKVIAKTEQEWRQICHADKVVHLIRIILESIPCAIAMPKSRSR
jgi:hypothetical protein